MLLYIFIDDKNVAHERYNSFKQKLEWCHSSIHDLLCTGGGVGDGSG